MPAVSKKQQKFMGMVHAMQKGTFHGTPSKKLKSAAKSMKKSDAKEFASTKHTGLPEKKAFRTIVNESIVKIGSPEGGAGVTIISGPKGTDESYPDSGPSGWTRKPDGGRYKSGKGRIFNNKFWSGLDSFSTNDIELNQAHQTKIAARRNQSKTKGTVGDILVSRLHRSYTTTADDLYALGHMSEKERIGLSGAITGALDKFRKVGDKKFPKLMNKKVGERDRQVVVTKTAFSHMVNDAIVKIAATKKKTKAETNYLAVSTNKKKLCKDCEYWRGSSNCTKVGGVIASKGTCDLFDKDKKSGGIRSREYAK